jgi:hypothetical protein
MKYRIKEYDKTPYGKDGRFEVQEQWIFGWQQFGFGAFYESLERAKRAIKFFEAHDRTQSESKAKVVTYHY